MPERLHKLARVAPLAIVSMVMLLLIAACGGAATPTAGGTAGPAGGGAAGGGAAVGETATIAVQGPTAVTNRPTGVPEVACQSNQKQIVWMVRNGPQENPWEANIVRPAFNKAYPNICLKILSINQPDIAVKREAMIASGEPLHVWSTNWGGDGFASDRARNLITDLTPLIQQDKFDTSVFIPEVLKIYQSEGKTWGLPFLTTGSYVYYNQKMFKDAGVPYPPVDWTDTSWTWEKFVETAKKLTKNVGDINKAQYGANYAVLNLEGPPMMWGKFIWPQDAYSTGYADKVSVTDDASVKAYQAFHDLVYKDKVAPDPASSKALDQLGGAFQSGRMAMTMSGGWGHWSFKGLIDDPNGFCWGVAPLPWGSPDAKIRTVIYTDPWVITRGLKGDDLNNAWTFVKFLVSPEQAAAYTKATGTPPTQTALLKDYYQQFAKCMKPEDMKTVFEGAFKYGRESSNHLIVKWNDLNTIWSNNLDPYFSDPNADTKKMLTTVEQQTNAKLQQIISEKGQ